MPVAWVPAQGMDRNQQHPSRERNEGRGWGVTVAPQILWICLTMLVLGVTMAMHGKPRPAFNFPLMLAGSGLEALLLWWGGFFEPIFR